MTVNELQEKLNEMGVPQNYYSLMIGGLPNERLCLVKDETWQVYYSERGNKVGQKFFEKEDDACDYFYKKLKRYATV